MRIIMDTSAYSQFMRGHGGIRDRLDPAEEICFNPIALGELISGFARGRFKSENSAKLKAFIGAPRVRLLNIDSETSDFYAIIRNALLDAGTLIPMNDIWIAASAMQYGLHVLTTDKHFQNVKQIAVEYVAV
jgi:tRNA(fMet)-specific endonuclease VapC